MKNRKKILLIIIILLILVGGIFTYASFSKSKIKPLAKEILSSEEIFTRMFNQLEGIENQGFNLSLEYIFSGMQEQGEKLEGQINFDSSGQISKKRGIFDLDFKFKANENILNTNLKGRYLNNNLYFKFNELKISEKLDPGLIDFNLYNKKWIKIDEIEKYNFLNDRESNKVFNLETFLKLVEATPLEDKKINGIDSYAFKISLIDDREKLSKFWKGLSDEEIKGNQDIFKSLNLKLWISKVNFLPQRLTINFDDDSVLNQFKILGGQKPDKFNLSLVLDLNYPKELFEILIPEDTINFSQILERYHSSSLNLDLELEKLNPKKSNSPDDLETELNNLLSQ